jgi:hypothetical protein
MLVTLTAMAFSHGAAPSAKLIPKSNIEQHLSKSNNATTAQNWETYGSGYTISSDVFHDGARSIYCQNDRSGETRGALRTIVLNQKSPQPIVLTGWSKASSVNGQSDTDYSIYADVTYIDNTFLWGQSDAFSAGTHGWEKRKFTIFPTKPIRSIKLYALFRNHTGSAWFADFSAEAANSAALFDGQPVSAPILPIRQSSGWFIRDVASDSAVRLLLLNSAALGVRATRLSLGASSKTIGLHLQNLRRVDRAMTVYYVERFDDRHPVWWDDIRHVRAADDNEEFGNFTNVSVGATGTMSLYPFACVTGEKHGRVLAIPPQFAPRVNRITYNAKHHLYFVAFDIALTASKSVIGHDSADVAVSRFDANPTWGFRNASSDYYSQFPKAFAVRARANGIWMPFTDPATVTDASDFHFAYHEGDNSVASDRAAGIQSLRYVEPMSYWMAMPASMPRTYAAAVALLQNLAEKSDAPETMHQAQAVLYSGSKDSQGRYNVSFRDTPWCNGAVWTLDPNPNMPHPPLKWTKAMLNAKGAPSGAPGTPDGEYLDSLELMADVLDYRPESLRASRVPLTFATDVNRPTLPTWFSVYESAASLSGTLHARGKILMGNTVPWRFSAIGSVLDVMGTETSMFDADGGWNPDSDEMMNLRRTIANHKPYLLLLNTDFTKLSVAKISLYMQRCVFYDIYPSMFSANAADAPYWKDPSLYNRDRMLFKQYIPVLQQLSAAGWEPVTYAKSTNSGVWIERYGNHMFTALNPSSVTIQTILKIDMKSLLPGYKRSANSLKVIDVMSHQVLAEFRGDSVLAFQIALQPSQTRVLQLEIEQEPAHKIVPFNSRHGGAKHS